MWGWVVYLDSMDKRIWCGMVCCPERRPRYGCNGAFLRVGSHRTRTFHSLSKRTKKRTCKAANAVILCVFVCVCLFLCRTMRIRSAMSHTKLLFLLPSPRSLGHRNIPISYSLLLYPLSPPVSSSIPFFQLYLIPSLLFRVCFCHETSIAFNDERMPMNEYLMYQYVLNNTMQLLHSTSLSSYLPFFIYWFSVAG